MNSNFQIKIENPCQEKWEGFTPTKEGGFCGACQKNVIDFSQMSDIQLVAYFRDLSQDNQNLCGRFRSEQLQKNYDIESWFPTWTMTENILNCEVPIEQFKNRQSVISLPIIQKMKMVRSMTMAVLTFAFVESYGQQKQILISGQVLDNEGLPLSGVNILIKNSKKGIISDKAGKYNLAVEDKDTLVFSFVGFERNELIRSKVPSVMKMKYDEISLGEVVALGYKTSTRGTFIGGGLSVLREKYTPDSKDEESFKFQETNFQKCATQIKALGNPTITKEVMIVPEISEKIVFNNSEEKSLAEDWYAENAFQNVESVQVYDLSGRIFATDFLKINDGKISVNLKYVPSGMYIVRVTYSNERSIEGAENSVVRVWVNK